MGEFTFNYNMSADWKTAVITGYEGNISGDIIIPSEIDGLKVTAIEMYAFHYCESLTSVVISNGITSIGTYAFGYCTNLTSVTIPNSITNIGDWAFDGCDKLTKVYLYKGSYADEWFDDGVKVYLGNGGGNEGGTSATYTVTYDANNGNNAPPQQTASEGELIYLSSDEPTRSGYKFKGWSVWYDTTSVDYYPGDSYYVEGDLYLYAVWEYIGGEDDSDFTFEINSENEVKITDYLGSGGHVIIPGEIQGLPVTEIGDDAFDNQSITSIKIPSSITKIGVGAFASCSNLKSLYVDDLESWLSVTLVALSSHPLYNQGGLLYINNELAENISIPDEIYEIKNAAFYNCDSLISVTIHKNVTSIGQMAFRRCNLLERMRFESKFVNIGDYAFYECYNLSTIYLFYDSSADEYFPRSDYTKIYLRIITYDATGGVFLGASEFEQIVVEEEIIHLIDEIPSKSGYEFKGWSRLSGSTEINYSPGNAYYVQDDLYLYAVWEKKESGGGDSPDFPIKKGKYRVLINGRPAKWKDNDGNYYYMYVTWED